MNQPPIVCRIIYPKNAGDEYMLTLSVSGRSNSEAIDILREAVSGETELKIQIDTPSQAQELQKFLETEGFTDILPEDDDGTLYLTASKKHPEYSHTKQESVSEEKTTPMKGKQVIPSEPKRYGIVLSGECRKHEREFLEKLIASLLETENRPEILCLMNGAVKLAAYDTRSCDVLKKLAADGVSVLLSAPCADRLGITEALGAGVCVSMSEILEAVNSCEKLLSL